MFVTDLWQKRKSQLIKVLFIGDTHGDNRKPSSRVDDYLESSIEEINECISIAKQMNCDFIVHLGDVFHRMEPFGSCRNAYMEIFKDAGMPCYVTVGNHDVKGDLQNIPNSALGSLISAGALIYVNEIPECKLGFLHYSTNLNHEIREGVLKSKNWVICAAHTSIVKSRFSDDDIEIKDIKCNDTLKMVVCGHIHDGFIEKRNDGLMLVNPGSICRVSTAIENINKKPKVFYLEYDTDGNIYNKNFIYLKCSKDYKDIFNDADKLYNNKKKHNMEEYIKRISAMKIVSEGCDIYKSIEASAKFKHVDQNVLDIVIKTIREVEECE